MLRQAALLASLALVACVPRIQGGPTTAPAVRAEAIETVKMADMYPVALVNIPVQDEKTKFIPAALYEPGYRPGPFPVAIVLNGCAGVNSDAGIVERLNEAYMAHGIATLVVDSFSPRGIGEVCSNVDFAISSVSFRVKDAYAAAAWLAARPEIDAKHVFLQGYSHGANTAIAATDAQRPLPERTPFAGVIAFYPYCDIRTKFSVPTIILTGAQDDWTPAQLCQDIKDKTSLELTIYPSTRHNFAAPEAEGIYLDHHYAYNVDAAADALERAVEFIEARRH